MAHNWLIGVALLLGFVLLLARERRPARSPAWMLLRCLFPSWRFFETITPGPALGYRVARAGQNFGPWQGALIAPPRTIASLLVNARGNLHLCYQSLVERLSDDLDDVRGATLDDQNDDLATRNVLERLVSYRLVQRLVQTLVEEQSVGPAAHDLVYQFRLTSLEEASEEQGRSIEAPDVDVGRSERVEFVSRPHAL